MVTTELDPGARDRLFAIPPVCFRIAETFALAGERLWLCGGTVRDLLLGIVPDDLDVASAAPPSRVRQLVPGALAGEQPGIQHGAVTLHQDGVVMEHTTFRREGPYEDGRSPAFVEFVGEIADDFARRDFTVNGLYLDLLSGEIVDPCGGLADVAQRRLRTIGPAEARLTEDSLRILRGLRLCARHDLVADAGTWAGIVAAAPKVANLSGTRVLQEIEGLLVARGRARGLVLLRESGVAAVLLPDVARLYGIPQPPEFHPEGEVFGHTALTLAELRDPVAPSVAWAALFHDVGKRACFVEAEDRIRFDGHDRVSAEMADEWLRRHGARRSLVRDVVELITEHIRIAAVPRFRPARRERFLRDRLFREHLELHLGDCGASHRKLDVFEELSRLRDELPPTPLPPLIGGRDLLAMGIPSGPAIGELLAAVEDARDAGTVTTADEARRFVSELWQRRSGGSDDRR